MQDDWCPVTEDLPPLEKRWENLSREVEVLLENGEKREAFYAYNRCQWFDAGTIRILKKVTHWRDKEP